MGSHRPSREGPAESPATGVQAGEGDQRSPQADAEVAGAADGPPTAAAPASAGHIFLSYKSEDRDRARALAEALERRGWPVWWDREIQPGEAFRSVIAQALQDAACVVVLWTERSVASEWVQEEAQEAKARNILLPALLDDVRQPIGFGQTQAANLIAWGGDPDDEVMGDLLRGVATLLGVAAVPALLDDDEWEDLVESARLAHGRAAAARATEQRAAAEEARRAAERAAVERQAAARAGEVEAEARAAERESAARAAEEAATKEAEEREAAIAAESAAEHAANLRAAAARKAAKEAEARAAEEGAKAAEETAARAAAQRAAAAAADEQAAERDAADRAALAAAEQKAAAARLKAAKAAAKYETAAAKAAKKTAKKSARRARRAARVKSRKWRWAALLIFVFAGGSAVGAFVVNRTTEAPTTAAALIATPEPVPAEPTTVAAPETLPPVDPAPAAVPETLPTLTVAGEPTVVYRTIGTCSPQQVPVLPTRALRDANGDVRLLISNGTSSWMVGPDLDSVVPDCRVTMASGFDPDPAAYDDVEYIAAVHTTDGETLHALVANDYDGDHHPGRCATFGPSCHDYSVTAAVSTDGGATFADAAEPPGHLVAHLPFVFEAGAGPTTGFRGPSNIITGPDGLLYAFMNVLAPDEQWVCLMRTDDMADPGAWRFWDGTEFAGRFVDPYRQSVDDPAAHECPPLDRDDIGSGLHESVVYHPGLGLYVLVGTGVDRWPDGRWGFYYSFSEDLVEWSHRRLLLEVDLPWTAPDGANDPSSHVPSLIDPDSTSRTFETTDDEAYLYFTRFNAGTASLDRDLVRVPVVFSRPADNG